MQKNFFSIRPEIFQFNLFPTLNTLNAEISTLDNYCFKLSLNMVIIKEGVLDLVYILIHIGT